MDERHQIRQDIKTTFTEFEAGKRVYVWLEKICYKYKQTLTIGFPDESAYKAGLRDVILEIDAQIRLANEPTKVIDTINTKENT